MNRTELCDVKFHFNAEQSVKRETAIQRRQCMMSPLLSVSSTLGSKDFQTLNKVGEIMNN